MPYYLSPLYPLKLSSIWLAALALSSIFSASVLANKSAPSRIQQNIVSNTSAAAVLHQVQDKYQQAGDMKASFAQTFYSRLLGKRPTETGLVWTKGNDRVRWQYQAPTVKYFFYNGHAAHFYEPDKAQVMQYDSFKDSPLSSALQFLLGQKIDTALFTVSNCTVGCNLAGLSKPHDNITTVKNNRPNTLRILTLTPKMPLGNVDHLLLVLDLKAARLLGSAVYDVQGNYTEYLFTNIVLRSGIKAEIFNFTPPDGVEIQRFAEIEKRLKPSNNHQQQ